MNFNAFATAGSLIGLRSVLQDRANAQRGDRGSGLLAERTIVGLTAIAQEFDSACRGSIDLLLARATGILRLLSADVELGGVASERGAVTGGWPRQWVAMVASQREQHE